MSQETQWAGLKAYGFSDLACAVIMGHAMAESGCETNRLQGDFEVTRSWSQTYTKMVDDGRVTREDFAARGPGGGGYGWLQWTYPQRKYGYYDNAKANGFSVGSEQAALSWLWEELHQPEYQPVLDALMNGNNLRQMSDVFMKRFERPADQSEKACSYRASLCQQMLDKFGGKYHPDTKPDGKWDWKIALIQYVMNHDGYWGEPDGHKSQEFFAAYEQYGADMKNC